jgi:tetratricopeptide (TPR) repeat protein
LRVGSWELGVAVLLALSVSGCSSAPRGPDVERAKEMRMAGDEAYKQKDYETAVEYYSSALEYNPEYAEAYLHRGNAYTWLAESEDAKKWPAKDTRLKAFSDFTACIKLNMASYDAYFNRGVMAATFKQYQGAVMDFLECTKLRSNDPEPHLLIGQIYESKFENMGLRAMDHYEEYVRKGGTNSDIVEKVKAWQAIKPKPDTTPKPKDPTPEEESRAKELHDKLTGLIGQGKNDEAFRVVDELLTKYGHTKYVRDRMTAFTAMHRALKPPEKK